MNAAILAAIAAWRGKCAICTEKFNEYVGGARALIEATGGSYVTTSPDEKGYCKDYKLREDVDGLLEGVTSEPPQHPDVGDACRALEMAHREAAYGLIRAKNDVVRLARELSGDAAAQVTDDALFAAVIALTRDAP